MILIHFLRSEERKNMKGKVNYRIFLLAICLLVRTIFAAMQQEKQLHLEYNTSFKAVQKGKQQK